MLRHFSVRKSPSDLDFEKERAKHSMNLAPPQYYKFTQNARRPRMNGSFARNRASVSSEYCGARMQGMILTAGGIGIQLPIFLTRLHTDFVYLASPLHLFINEYVNPSIE